MYNLDVLNNAKSKKQRVGILGLGKYCEGFVKRIWFDDADDIVELYTPETKRNWQIMFRSIALVKVL